MNPTDPKISVYQKKDQDLKKKKIGVPVLAQQK